MHDVTDMHQVKSPQNILNQSDQYFSTLTNDYNYSVNCCSMHSNVVAMLWCLDDTHIPYLEIWNLFLVTIFHIWQLRRNWLGNTGSVSNRSGKQFLSQFSQICFRIVKCNNYFKFIL